jgi:S-methylmethionine-dependent homocysteine/selenocysteine methylase
VIKDRLQSGEVLVLDGAIGTELENHGIPQLHDASWAECLVTHPEIVQKVHEDYVKAGADIITTNTYSSGPNVLRKINQGAEIEKWNSVAVELARRARDNAQLDRDIYVAGSVSAFGNGAMRYQGLKDGIQWGETEASILKSNFLQQIDILVKAGVDFILLELLGAGVDDIQLAVETTSGCDVPICLALSGIVFPDDDEIWLQTTDGESGLAKSDRFADAIERISSQNLLALLTHHLEIDLVNQALAEIKRQWQGPAGVYPNRTGHWNGKQWVFVENVTPDGYAELAKDWVNEGAQIIGGCCGVSPAHISAVSEILKENPTPSISN